MRFRNQQFRSLFKVGLMQYNRKSWFICATRDQPVSICALLV